MATNERLFHNWLPFMEEWWMCDKCGARARSWEAVDRISMNPCVDDDDPCVARHQEMMQTEINEMWQKARSHEMPIDGIKRGVAQPAWTIHDKTRFNTWLNGPDPVMDLDWTENPEMSSNEDRNEGDESWL